MSPIAKNIIGLENYSVAEIEALATAYVNELKNNLGLDDTVISVSALRPFGSRVIGSAKTKSDLDIYLKYSGSAKEDTVFNVLNSPDNRLFVEGIPVDFFPVKI